MCPPATMVATHLNKIFCKRQPKMVKICAERVHMDSINMIICIKHKKGH